MNNFLNRIYSSIFQNTKMSWFWLVLRLYVGWEWLYAGYEKVINPVWVSDTAGGAIIGFVNGALTKTSGDHPDVTIYYAWFLQHIVLPNSSFWSHLIAYGEVLVGLGLIFGLFTALAAFFGLFMNLNYLLAGTVSSNPVLLILSLLILLARKIAGFIGLDYFRIRKSR